MTQPTPPENPREVFWLYAEPVYAPFDELTRARLNTALDAALAAGRLLPAGTETRTEWATRLKAHGQYDEELVESFSAGGFTEEERARSRAKHWRGRFGDDLVDVMRREVHTTPWTVAQPAAEVKP